LHLLWQQRSEAKRNSKIKFTKKSIGGYGKKDGNQQLKVGSHPHSKQRK